MTATRKKGQGLHRNTISYVGIIITFGGALLTILSTVVVMEPEYTAYQHSPHARVKCVECHVGPGTSFYVKSKLSGTNMVGRTILNNYTTPIPTPIAHLRPARETCEECHWPEKFYGAHLRGSVAADPLFQV